MSARVWFLGRPDGRVNLRLPLAGLPAAMLLAALCLLLGFASLRAGALALDGHQTWLALWGEGNPLHVAVLGQWRLPRVMMALLLGAGLGLAGAIYQSLLRNPLGSPDVIGFGSGAHSGALLCIVLWQGGHAWVAASAVAGGLATALLVYALSWARGVHGFRLILVGIAVSAMLGAFNTWLMLTAQLESAMMAAMWAAGSLNGMTWQKGLPSAVFIVLAILAAAVLQRRMRLLEMGDDSAGALGVAVERTRWSLLALGVVLTGAATAAAGPIAFIALAAPQLAQRLQRSRATCLASAAWMGALLLLAADYIAQHAFFPRQLPVGIVTISIGGVYLVWLLLRQTRQESS